MPVLLENATGVDHTRSLISCDPICGINPHHSPALCQHQKPKWRYREQVDDDDHHSRPSRVTHHDLRPPALVT